jgi:hypothetical protein
MPRDFAVLNQLSFDCTQSKFAFIALLNEIASLFKSASLFGLFRLRTNAEFRYERLSCGLQVDAAIMSLNDTERGLLLSILDTPYTKDDLSEEETSEIVSLSIESLNQCKVFSHEIACSYILKCLTVSFDRRKSGIRTN